MILDFLKVFHASKNDIFTIIVYENPVHGFRSTWRNFLYFTLIDWLFVYRMQAV